MPAATVAIAKPPRRAHSATGTLRHAPTNSGIGSTQRTRQKVGGPVIELATHSAVYGFQKTSVKPRKKLVTTRCNSVEELAAQLSSESTSVANANGPTQIT